MKLVITWKINDTYVNKRIDLVGNLLNNLFRNYFNKLVKDMNKLIIKEINNGSWKSNENYEATSVDYVPYNMQYPTKGEN